MSLRSLKQLRLRLKLTQAAAAALVRVSPNTWARWERGEAKPRGASRQEGITSLPLLAWRNHLSPVPPRQQAGRHPQHSTARSLIKFAATWIGDDLEERLSEVYAWRGRAAF
ncbi:MAG: helix-turn-helix domain-containing protein [Terriglobia bacterium]|jgi:transcriptional regulator with XRE-family HTH domain